MKHRWLTKHSDLVENGILLVMAVCFIGLGLCVAQLWNDYHPDIDHEIKIVTTEYHITGDVNGDGRVNEADTEIVKSNIGKANPTYADGDLNSDGKVDSLDLSIVLKYQGNGDPKIILISV